MVQYLSKIKDSIVCGLQWASWICAFCDENMVGIRYRIHDVTFHADIFYRGGGQLLRLCLTTDRLIEPVCAVSSTFVFFVVIQESQVVGTSVHAVLDLLAC